ncbi:MAG: tyrosine-protein phosphatase [Anaerolineae bacterium]
MPDDALLTERHLHWPACPNVRDLGGFPAHNGHVTAAPHRTHFGRYVRSDSPELLTTEGWKALVAHGVRTIIDLRSPREIALEPYTLPQVSSAVRRQEIAMLPLDAEMMRLLEDAPTRGAEYILFVEHYQAPIADILRAIAGAPAGGVLYHCQAGKDRTGIITALLLGLAGVPEEIIVADYAVSQTLLRPRWQQEVAEALAAGKEPPFEPLTEPETMRTLLDHLATRYGGVEGYMNAIGVDGATREALLRRLLH